jgi:hypothetical protein
MASLAASNVTVISAYFCAGNNGRRNVRKLCSITGITVGGQTNKILASAFGLQRLDVCTNLFLDATADKVYPTAIAPDGSYLVLTAPTQATDANRADPADLAIGSDVAYITVEGPVLYS